MSYIGFHFYVRFHRIMSPKGTIWKCFPSISIYYYWPRNFEDEGAHYPCKWSNTFLHWVVDWCFKSGGGSSEYMNVRHPWHRVLYPTGNGSLLEANVLVPVRVCRMYILLLLCYRKTLDYISLFLVTSHRQARSARCSPRTGKRWVISSSITDFFNVWIRNFIPKGETGLVVY